MANKIMHWNILEYMKEEVDIMNRCDNSIKKIKKNICDYHDKIKYAKQLIKDKRNEKRKAKERIWHQEKWLSEQYLQYINKHEIKWRFINEKRLFNRADMNYIRRMKTNDVNINRKQKAMKSQWIKLCYNIIASQ